MIIYFRQLIILAVRVRMSMSAYIMFFLLFIQIPKNGTGRSYAPMKITKKPQQHPLATGELSKTDEFNAWMYWVTKTHLYRHKLCNVSSTPIPYIKNSTSSITDGGFATLGLCANTSVGNCHVLQWITPTTQKALTIKH